MKERLRRKDCVGKIVRKTWERICEKKDCERKLVKERLWKRYCERDILKERLWKRNCERKIMKQELYTSSKCCERECDKRFWEEILKDGLRKKDSEGYWKTD